MTTFLTALILVILSELGDKSQFLMLALISTFKKPIPIIIATFLATFLNYSIISLLGIVLKHIITIFLIIGISLFFIKSEKLKFTAKNEKRIFITSFISIFLIEIGDKSELIVMSLSAHFGNLLSVVLGSVLGFSLINLPIIFFGRILINKLQFKYVRIISATIFLIIASILFINEFHKFFRGKRNFFNETYG